VFAALIAIMMLVGGLFILKDEFAQLFRIFTLDSLLLTMGVMFLVGLCVCTLSTFVVVNRLVGYNRDQLYAY
jgi:cell division transport system permease protein